ncbi:MAG: 50S ribosomal protein L13, partial [Clostridia bacterium]|nr:50S ribosomal protein L13 [Clostridia bacterium]
VIVLNTDKIELTGKKAEQKYYRYHTGYVGGLKEIRYDKLMAEKSDFALQKAVKGMLPKNSLGRTMIKKLFAYKGSEHPHAAQQPKELILK